MTKLTTEITIEELQYRINAHENDLTRVWTADYFLSVQKELLALKQAAKNPAAWVATDSEDFPEYNSHNEFSADCGAGTPLYAAPVLPKQPELVENLKKVMNSWLAMEPKLAFQPEFTDVMMLLDAEAARAQPVIPEGLLQAINRLLDNDGSRGCFDALEQHRAKTELERLLASTAQPVSEPYKSAANDIIAERQRQISEEGWTPEHDDKYNDFQLALAAAGYAQNVADYAGEYCQPHSSINWTDAPEPEAWPWSPVWWKPTNPRRDLVKAGALILAEIERLDRAATAQE